MESYIGTSGKADVKGCVAHHIYLTTTTKKTHTQIQIAHLERYPDSCSRFKICVLKCFSLHVCEFFVLCSINFLAFILLPRFIATLSIWKALHHSEIMSHIGGMHFTNYMNMYRGGGGSPKLSLTCNSFTSPRFSKITLFLVPLIDLYFVACLIC